MTRMIDISEKVDVARRAVARGEIILKKGTIDAIKDGSIIKGDVLSTAKVAGVQAAKVTWKLIPMCHQIPITSVNISMKLEEERVICECDVKGRYKTGVEMEALVGATMALLTIWDMVKYLEKDAEGQYPTARIDAIKVVRKEKMDLSGEEGDEPRRS